MSSGWSTGAASKLQQRHKDAGIRQQDAQAEDARASGELPATPVDSRQRPSAHRPRAMERAPRMQSMGDR